MKNTKNRPARQMLSVNDLAPPGSRYRTLRVRQEEVDRYLRQREVRG